MNRTTSKPCTMFQQGRSGREGGRRDPEPPVAEKGGWRGPHAAWVGVGETEGEEIDGLELNYGLMIEKRLDTSRRIHVAYDSCFLQSEIILTDLN